MTAPFPGMDPFLEEPAIWHGFHTRLIVTLSDILAERVAPNFSVRIEERVEILSPDEFVPDLVAPDVYIIHTGKPQHPTATNETISAPTLIEPVYEDEVRHRYIEIRDNRDKKEVITTIDVLSPYNKARGTRGQASFLKKRRQVIGSNTQWIEIDLLRGGERPPEVAGKVDYHVLLKRGRTHAPFVRLFESPVRRVRRTHGSTSSPCLLR